MFNIENIIRSNIRDLVPYSSARDEFTGEASVYLDANENSLGSVLGGYHRYPDPMQRRLKEAIAVLKNANPAAIFLGNGSDECIDTLYRCFCEPGMDNVIVCPPTYGMYQVSAAINNVEARAVPLTPSFQLDEQGIRDAIDAHTKMIWICSPNNPTGNSLDPEVVMRLLEAFKGLVVVDEAYVDFATDAGWLEWLGRYANLVVMQTFSKSWGLAGLRLGVAFASPVVIGVMNKVKPPYNINQLTQQLVLQALQRSGEVGERIMQLKAERDQLRAALGRLEPVIKVYPSEANFLLVKFRDAKTAYRRLAGKGIIVRDRSNVLHCQDCLRITVGTAEENAMLINTIKEFSIEPI